MSAPLDTTELRRLAWLNALRQQGHRKCTEYYFLEYDSKPTRVCALGLLMEVAGLPLSESPEVHEIGVLAGLSHHQSNDVAMMNDGGGCYQPHTFAQLADVVEGWFSKEKT